MKASTRCRILSGVLIALLGAAHFASGEESDQLRGDTSAQQAVLLAYWNAADDVTLTCAVIRSPTHAGESGNELQISSGGKKLFSFAPDLTPLSMFPTNAVRARLVTIWLSGSGAYRVFIFAVRAGRVVQVLDAGSKVMPEFVFGSLSQSDYAQRVVVSKGDWTADDKSGVAYLRPLTADVYSWNGTSYEMRKDVPWSERLRQ